MNKTIESLTKNNYFLLTYENPKFKPKVVVKNRFEFEEILYYRLQSAKQVFADSVIITPCLGQYGGVVENSFSVSFNHALSLVDKLMIIDIIENLSKDLGQESFIFRNESNNQVMFNAQNGSVMATGTDFSLLNEDTVNNFSIINGVKFSLNFEFLQ